MNMYIYEDMLQQGYEGEQQAEDFVDIRMSHEDLDSEEEE